MMMMAVAALGIMLMAVAMAMVTMVASAMVTMVTTADRCQSPKFEIQICDRKTNPG
jgi:hypothetical protein